MTTYFVEKYMQFVEIADHFCGESKKMISSDPVHPPKTSNNTETEVTALRTKVAELEETNAKTEAKIRTRIRREFSVAMRKLFGLSFRTKISHRSVP
ncbi:hypothetical protein AHF37_11587 [Paragonimus kellicotti]|nr:hypothetical protein AHF37_11587 [Paragonimus kellicotti]